MGFLVLLMGAGFAREMVRSRQIDKEILALEKEAEQLQVKNFKIASLTRSLNDDEFLEREARLKLGMRMRGERVVVLRRTEKGVVSKVNANGDLRLASSEEWSNSKKWWMYFADRVAYDEYAVRNGFK